MHWVTDTSGGLTHNKIDRDDGRPTTGLLLLVVIFDILYFKSYHFGQKNIKQCSLQLPLNWSITGHATHRGANDQIMSQSVIVYCSSSNSTPGSWVRRHPKRIHLQVSTQPFRSVQSGNYLKGCFLSEGDDGVFQCIHIRLLSMVDVSSIMASG